MSDKKLFLISEASDNLLSGLDSREVALWLRSLPTRPPARDRLVSFLGLPWQLIISEISDSQLIKAIEQPSNSDGAMVRKRGFFQIIESDPSRMELPQRCLPFYLLNGREGMCGDPFPPAPHCAAFSLATPSPR
jgi:hypothetical protein